MRGKVDWETRWGGHIHVIKHERHDPLKLIKPLNLLTGAFYYFLQHGNLHTKHIVFLICHLM